jgi:hypothetical protein
MAMKKRPTSVSRARPLLRSINLGVYFLAILVIAASAAFIADLDAYRTRFDATKTRAYSLSEQSRALLRELEGDWTIAIVLVEQDVDRAVSRQIDEVLARFREGSALIQVERIDPTDPASLIAYEGLIQRLRDLYGPDIEAYEGHLAQARSALAAAIQYSATEAQALVPFIAQVGPDGELGRELAEIRNNFALLAQNGPQILQSADAALASDDAKPLPDHERARDTLHAGATQAAEYLAAVAARYERRSSAAGVPDSVRSHFARAGREHQARAVELMTAADPLVHLRPLGLTTIAEELARGEAAVITGNGRAAVIPAWQLFPRSQREGSEGTVAFDERFRGEQIIASAIRSLLVPRMPLVVFVHSRSQSILAQTGDGKDCFGASSILQSSRYEVEEWRINENDPPAPEPGQRAIWIIVPPAPGEAGGNPAVTPREELLLIDRAQALLERGEPTLISFYPSVLPKLRQNDPWQSVAAAAGIEIDTSRVLFEISIAAEGRSIPSQHVEILDFTTDHAIPRAMHGRRLGLVLPVALRLPDPDFSRQWVIAQVEPAGNRWLEADWVMALAGGDAEAAPEQTEMLTEPVVLAAAAERPDPSEPDGSQRMIAVGSGSWMLTGVADTWDQLGGERVALRFPGNYELLQAAVAWLAEMDDLIARSPTSQQVERLEGLTSRNRAVWWWIVMAGMPAGTLALGAFVWLVRRT